MEPLSSFAISIASGIVLNLITEFNKNVDKDLKKAFNNSLRLWSKNSFIRDRNETKLFIKLKKVFDNPNIIENELKKDDELNIFYTIFDKEICKYPSASSYLNKITNRQQFKEVKEKLNSIKLVNEILHKKIYEISDVLNKLDPAGILKDEHFELIINDYYLVKENNFKKEVWPYQISKQEFVSLFDFKTGTISNRNKIHTNEHCVEHIALSLQNSKVFCLGFYGMGKTTVSKFLFSTIKILPKFYTIFISLSYKTLPNSATITEFIFDELKKNSNQTSDLFINMKIQINNKINELLNKGKLIIIFDGLDESIYSNISLKAFATCIKEEVKNSFLTSRLEFSNFFSIFEREFRTNGYAIELKKWKNKQWNTYLNALKNEYNFTTNRMSSFKIDLLQPLSKLAERPLFFRMITDLYLIGRAELDIPNELKDNLATIYYNFINWKIRDDIRTRGASIPAKSYNLDFLYEQVFRLFTEIALKEYVFFQKNEIKENEKSSKQLIRTSQVLQGIKIEEILEIVNNNPFYEIEVKDILNLFLSSTLFSTILNKDKLFKFSHKSFMEYLVAYKLASDIFDNNKIGKTWDLYQTYEVSNQFQSEIKRRIYYTGGGLPKDNIIIKEVFIKELNTENKFTDYSERIEEVLYYLGKFQIQTDEILQKLFNIIKPNSNAHPFFIRTSYITLARLGKYEYLEEFVIKLIESYNTDKLLFNINKELDIKYYGESSIRNKLLVYVNQYIEEARLDKLNILRIFSFFTSTNLKVNEDMNLMKILNAINFRAKKENHSRIVEICKKIEEIIKQEENVEQ